MKARELKQMVEGSLDELADAVEQGKSEKLKRYLAMLARFHRYSLGNVLLIGWQRPDATRVAGFHTWKRLGRHVKRGERGIRILAPIVRRRRKRGEDEERQEDDDGDKTEEEIAAFRSVAVFDLAQTKGRPLEEFARTAGNPGEYAERLRQFIERRGIGLAFSDRTGGAEGYSTGGKIVVRRGLEPAEEFSVLVHEMAHELLHQDDAAREQSRTVRETEAEAVAFVVCQAVGLEARSSATDYIHLYDGDKKTLMASLGRIRATAVEIIEGIAQQETPGPKQQARLAEQDEPVLAAA